MAKDNIPFHTISFPATILGSGEDWKLVDFIKGFNWLLYEGGKFSTSENRGIFMDRALELYPADYWRWWLLSNAPENSDTDFTWESFQATVNKDLADILGNFVARVTSFSTNKFGSKIPTNSTYGKLEKATTEKLQNHLNKYQNLLKKMEIRKSANELRSIWVIGNEYLQKSQPWLVVKKDPSKAEMIIRYSINLIHLYSVISEPFIPATCCSVRDHFKFPKTKNWPYDLKNFLSSLNDSQRVSVPRIMFKKILDAERVEFQNEFSGINNP